MNMKLVRRALKGFTLLEMLLVMVIISVIILGIATYSEQKMAQLKQDRAVLQIQQILNAGLAFYLNNTTWPTSIETDLQGNGTTTGGYLPGPSSSVTIVNPWGSNYVIGHSTSTSAPNALFAVCTTINAGAATASIAKILAGRLPMAYVANGNHSADCATSAGIPAGSTCAAAPCTVVAAVNVPGQNLNNARSVNFAGVYHHGACVAKPPCPALMAPQILVVPVSVSGMNYAVTDLYPISSFTAYIASGGTSSNPGPCNPSETNTPACPSGGTYWRVCLQIITQNGQVVYNINTGAAAATILAITRCSPQGESTEPTVSGSSLDVFSY
jgi:prepilin-type N-terminal cleavage/methylation domain-containing protein